MSTRYHYVGPVEIRAKVLSHPAGTFIDKATDVLEWVSAHPDVAQDELVEVTFVVDVDERLRIADRRSEHVACALGGEVLAAGELFYGIGDEAVSVEEASNQSTGYCPEPESWDVVERVLDRIGLAHPGAFTTICVFRRCTQCGQRNIVKDEWFFCDVCGTELDQRWNFGS